MNEKSHIDVEGHFLAYLISYPDRCIEVKPEMFIRPFHRSIFESIRESYSDGETDMLAGCVQRGIDLRPLMQLCADHPQPEGASEYQVKENWLNRETENIIVEARKRKTGLDQMLYMREALEVLYGSLMRAPAVSSHDKFVRRLTDESETILTGLHPLDRHIGGLVAGDYILFAARPSIGKTSLAVTLAYQLARRNIGVEFHSYEMTDEEVRRSFVSLMSLEYQTPVSVNNIRRRKFTPDELGHLIHYSERLEEMPLRINNSSMVELSLLTDSIRKSDAPVHFVDHISKVPVAGIGADSRMKQVMATTQALSGLAKRTGKIIIPLVQLNRQVEGRSGDNARPQLSDLRDTGELEQDAGAVVFIHEPNRVYTENKPSIVTVELIYAKVRDGQRDVYHTVSVNRDHSYFFEPTIF